MTADYLLNENPYLRERDELLAHLVDDGTISAEAIECHHEWCGSIRPKSDNPSVVCVWCGVVRPRAALVSERSGGDGA